MVNKLTKEEQIASLVGEITKLGYYITQKGKHTVITHYFGHVNKLEIDIHINGWKQEQHKYISAQMGLKEKKTVIAELKYLLVALHEILQSNKVRTSDMQLKQYNGKLLHYYTLQEIENQQKNA